MFRTFSARLSPELTTSMLGGCFWLVACHFVGNSWCVYGTLQGSGAAWMGIHLGDALGISASDFIIGTCSKEEEGFAARGVVTEREHGHLSRLWCDGCRPFWLAAAVCEWGSKTRSWLHRTPTCSEHGPGFCHSANPTACPGSHVRSFWIATAACVRGATTCSGLCGTPTCPEHIPTFRSADPTARLSSHIPAACCWFQLRLVRWLPSCGGAHGCRAVVLLRRRERVRWQRQSGGDISTAPSSLSSRRVRCNFRPSAFLFSKHQWHFVVYMAFVKVHLWNCFFDCIFRVILNVLKKL